MKVVPFFSDEIVITPHTATNVNHVYTRVSIREFAAGEPVSLYELENGELLARKANGQFIEGPEAVA